MKNKYAELHLHTNYSFQEGASSIGELVGQAASLGYQALAVTDHDNLCGAVEFAEACHDAGIQPIIGCEVTLAGGFHLTLLAETRLGYGNLCWLVSQAHREDRRRPELDPALLEGRTQGLIALSGCRLGEVPSLLDEQRFAEAGDAASRYRGLFGEGNYFLELQQHLVQGDTRRNQRLVNLAQELGVGVVAAGNVHYHVRERHRLQDCLVAIRNNTSLEESHRERRPNSEFFLKPPETMACLFQWCPEAVENTARIARRCAAFDLAQDLGYQFPDHPAPKGHTTQTYLERICYQAAERRYGSVTSEVRQRLDLEFGLIQKHNLAGFFLIYRDIVLLAQEVAVDLGLADPETPVEFNPPGRGRGSSVSMLVGYLLGISHIDPLSYGLSLERFLPDDELASVPDIDLDFPRNIREELILRVHEKYGWERAALTGMIDTYRMRGAVRDLGQALGLPPDQVGKLAKRVDEREGLPLGEQMRLLPDFQDKVKAPLWQHLIEFAGQLYGFPRRLAQHPGGMVIGSSPLTDIVPVQPSAIQGRYVMQWDKDSIEQARFVKIDFLAIGALSQMQDALRAIEARHGTSIDLSRIDFEDPSVYAMLHKADTIGVFQVESAAQQQTIPRIKPQNLIDMAHEVAAVRPGVGANDGVRRYIDRRLGLEPVEYVHELERRALERTLGVILFQDQINQIAHDVGGLSHSEADRLRRAFTKRNNGPMIQRWWGRFRDGALARGVDEETARRIFNRFNGHYMFPESHAFAFGVTAYQISWLKRYYPLEFYLGLFNQQPMGFYTPETLKEDAKRRGVGILSPDVNLSAKLCVIEEESIRLGLSYVKGLGEEAARAIAGAKERAGSFLSLADFMARSGLEQQQVEDLIDAGALDSLCEDRRMARWEVGLRYRPVGRQMELALPVEQDLAPLPKAGTFDEMAREYRTMGLHPASHVMAYIRESLGTRVLTSDEAASVADGERITVAGLVIRRQRPLAKAVFITLEDEHGHIPMVVWPKSYARLRNELKAPFLVVTGVMSRREGTYNLVVEKAKPMYVIPHPPESRNFH